jgi:putative transposase
MARKRKEVNDKIKQFAQELVAECKSKDMLFSENGIAQQLQKHLLEAALSGELDEYLGYGAGERANTDNARNGYATKQLQTPSGKFELEVPRDRDASFEPTLIKKRQTRFAGLDKKIISMYARGLSLQDIQGQLEALYEVDVSSSFISAVTASVLDDVIAWQNRPLDRLYPIVYLDFLVVKVREDKRIMNKAVYLALGVNSEGHKELLGLWISQNEGAKFWLNVLTELKNRGLEDIFITCVDVNSHFIIQ